MDKFRALEYFIATAREGSFSGASRALGVSVAAVAKLVSALENTLGLPLFERIPSGVTLTSEGASYLLACAPAIAQLREADELTKGAGVRVPGTIVVGVQTVIANGALSQALPRFHACYPEIMLDIRDVSKVISDEDANGIDVLLTMGWPKSPNLVQRRIAAGRFIVVASPDYWNRHGIPTRPKELERHNCLPIRSLDGTLMDMWAFTRGEETELVTARGWLWTSNSHRDTVIQLALKGEGVIRVLDWTNMDDIASGYLVRALGDWQSPEAPPVNILYRASARRSPRVRAFIDFAKDLFHDLESRRGEAVAATERPTWMGKHYGKVSASPTRSR
jgi:LysR family transcriptional regulator, regulator for bpeEF and oprC